jgi:hypothetical protein
VKEIYKMEHLEGSGSSVLYIGRTVLKGYKLKDWPMELIAVREWIMQEMEG